MARSFVSQFTDAQLVVMKPGNRLDIAGQWKLWIFTQAFISAAEAAARGLTREAAQAREPWYEGGVEVGNRAFIDAREPNLRAGLEALTSLEIINGFQLLAVPANWQPKDALYTFPFDDELAEELANRGL